MIKNLLDGSIMKKKMIIAFFVFAIVGSLLFYLNGYLVFVSALKNQVADANINMFNKTSQIIDNNLMHLNSIALATSKEAYVLDVAMTDFDFKKSDYVNKIKTAQTNLSYLKYLNKDISEVYLYNFKSNFIISSNGEFNYADKFSEQWLKEFLNKQSKYDVWNQTSSGNGDFAIARCVPFLSTDPLGIVIIKVSFNALNSVFMQDNSYNKIVIYNKTGDCLTGFENSYEGLGNKLIEESQNLNYGSFVEKNQMVTFYESKYTNFLYASIIPTKTLLKSVNQGIIISLLMTLLIIFIMIIFIEKLTDFIYQPIQQIIDIIDISNVQNTNSRDEVQKIINTINNLNSQRDFLEDYVFKTSTSLKKKFLLNLLSGREYTTQQFESNIKNYNINFPYENFYIIIFVIDRFAEFCEKYSQNDRILWKYGISNIVDELLNKFATGYCSEVENGIVSIMNIQNEDMTVVENIVNDIKKSVKSYVDIDLSAAISNPVTNINNISNAYTQSKEAIKYRAIYGHGSTIIYDKIKENNDDDENAYIHITKLSNYILTNNQEMIFSMIDNYISNLINTNCKNILLVSANVAIIISGVANQLRLSNEQKINIDSFETFSEIEEYMKQVFVDMANELTKQTPEKNIFLEEILQYIDKNYKRDISLDELVDVVGKSRSYISRLVNAELGMSLIDYVNQKKIIDAKKMLISNYKMSIKEICESLGFVSVHTFIRTFKKIEGITPGKYRDSLSINSFEIED